MMDRAFTLLIVLVGHCGLAVADPAPNPRAEIEYFERKIRPLLVEHCYRCHSSQANTIHGGLRLDGPAAVQAGGDSGPALVPGRPEESLLIRTVRYDGDIQMPPEGKLPDSEIEKLFIWIARGAAYPTANEAGPATNPTIDFEEGRKWWSFQPVDHHPVPNVLDHTWPETRLDSFVLAAMEREGLAPSARAARATLIRRLFFDVIGLPPTPEQVRQFVRNDAHGAYEEWVDQLLASPAYGEKWGRWWLDMARYTDRTASWLYQTGQSHFYRDWVVQAFNDDLPYDEFVRRQLATDLMPRNEPQDLPALGFISLSPTYWKELKLPCEVIKTIVADEWEERVDAVSRTFLGLTVACARCHDHKFDPISSEDYYALAGIFASCRQVERPLISESEYAPVRKAKQQVAKVEAEIATLKAQKPRPETELNELHAKVALIKSETPRYDTPMTNALSEESMFVVRAGKTPQDGTKLEYRHQPRDLPAFIRGNPNRPGPIIPRRFVTVLSSDRSPYRNGSGRLELADSILSDAAPLAARVIVNRIWLAHFGRGIVGTPSNFGVQGDRPTHPKLLDDLAAQFIANGWSIKKLHRQILLSATWQQSSLPDRDRMDVDPDNRWLSRMNASRLTFEAWRDAMLSCSGDLVRSMGGPSVSLDAAENHRRTLYATIHRRDMSPTLMVHDFPDPTQHSPKRTSTITALQGLYALNGPLLLGQSQSLAHRLRCDVPGDRQAQIERAYWILFSREPNEKELRIGLDFLAAAAPDQQSDRLQQYLHVLLASNELMFID